MAIESFSSSILTHNPRAYQSSLMVLNNFFRVLHMATLQVLIASLPHSPQLLLILLVSIELIFFMFTIVPYIFYYQFIFFIFACTAPPVNWGWTEAKQSQTLRPQSVVSRVLPLCLRVCKLASLTQTSTQCDCTSGSISVFCHLLVAKNLQISGQF